MAITFTEEKKKQRYLILVFLLVILVAAGVVWWGFLRKEKPVVVSAPSWSEVKIDFNVLVTSFLKDIKIFENIVPFEGQSGRENPFAPR